MDIIDHLKLILYFYVCRFNLHEKIYPYLQAKHQAVVPKSTTAGETNFSYVGGKKKSKNGITNVQKVFNVAPLGYCDILKTKRGIELYDYIFI